MHQPSPSTRPCGAARARGLVLPALACALLAAGCEEERHESSARPRSRAADIVGVDLGDRGRETPQPKAQPAPRPQVPRKPEFIVGKRTRKIENAGAALETGKARVASTRIVARDPITLPGNAYGAIIGQTSMMSIKQAMDLYHATNDRYPADYNEFMEVIVKANNISLPQLPHYREYGYDSNAHQLIILEYEDRKNPPTQ